MSSDPLPLPEIWSDLPEGGAYEGTRTEFVANGRGGLVLVEYAGGFAQTDAPGPQPVVRPIERAERPTAQEPLASLAPAALAKGLADLTAIVAQAEALLRAQGALKGEVHFAVERIADVAIALRMRDVDSALCDTLDASMREVGDAIVRHEAAATGALSAAALLRDVVRRLDDLMVVASRMLASAAEPLVRQPAAEPEISIEAAAPVATEATAATETPAPVVSKMEATIETPAPVAIETDAGVESLASGVSEPDAVIEAPASVVTEAPGTIDAFAHVATETPLGGSEVLVEEAGAGPKAETLRHSAADAPVARAVDIALPDGDHARSLRDSAEPSHDVITPAESSAAVTLHPQSELSDDKDEAASAEIAVEAASAVPAADEATASVAAETRSERELSHVASSPSAGEAGTTAPPKPRRPANDPFAMLHGLSEEELIALFS